LVSHLNDELSDKRGKRKRAASIRQIGGARLDKEKEQTRISGRHVAVQHAAGNPYAALRWDYPHAARNTTCHPAPRRHDELPFSMPVLGRFAFILRNVDPYRMRSYARLFRILLNESVRKG